MIWLLLLWYICYFSRVFILKLWILFQNNNISSSSNVVVVVVVVVVAVVGLSIKYKLFV